jgi:hypothetical protein
VFIIFRNVVTGAHYHFVSRWTSSSAYIVAALVMMVFVSRLSNIIAGTILDISYFALRILHASPFISDSIVLYPFFLIDCFNLDAIKIFSTPNLCLHSRTPSNARIQHQPIISCSTSINGYSGISW